MGQQEDLDAMLPAVYDELRRIAAGYMSRERDGHTLQPTAVVHEAYFELRRQHALDFANRAQLLGVAARLMRRVLLHHAETRNAAKRGAALRIDYALDGIEASVSADFSHLNAAIDRLAAMDETQARIVEMRCFGGLTIEESAEALGISASTVKREWNVARLWLRRELA